MASETKYNETLSAFLSDLRLRYASPMLAFFAPVLPSSSLNLPALSHCPPSTHASRSPRPCLPRSYRSLEARVKVAKDLREYVESESRSGSSESFTVFMADVYRLLMDLVNSPETSEKLAGVMLLDELIEVPYEENENKIIRFVNYLRMIFYGDNPNVQLLAAAARALGHVARAGGTLASDVIGNEIRRALLSLQNDKGERQLAALLVLRELAESVPTMMGQYLESVLELLWEALRDPHELNREHAIEALRQCIGLIGKRVPQARADLYSLIYRVRCRTPSLLPSPALFTALPSLA